MLNWFSINAERRETLGRVRGVSVFYDRHYKPEASERQIDFYINSNSKYHLTGQKPSIFASGFQFL